MRISQAETEASGTQTYQTDGGSLSRIHTWVRLRGGEEDTGWFKNRKECRTRLSKETMGSAGRRLGMLGLKLVGLERQAEKAASSGRESRTAHLDCLGSAARAGRPGGSPEHAEGKAEAQPTGPSLPGDISVRLGGGKGTWKCGRNNLPGL